MDAVSIVGGQGDSRAGVIPVIGMITGIVLIAEAIVLILLVGDSARLLLPVSVDLGGMVGHAARRITVARVDLGIAAVVLVVLVALARMIVVIPPYRRPTVERSLIGLHDARSVEFALTSSITVFLVAQLNGIADVGALVSMYAATSAMTLFAVIQERGIIQAGNRRLALCFGAAIGIVPWGVIAFHQVGAEIIADGPPLIVTMITLTMLAISVISFVAWWGEHAPGRQEHAVIGRMPRGDLIHAVSSTVSVSLFAWLVVLGLVT